MKTSRTPWSVRRRAGVAGLAVMLVACIAAAETWNDVTVVTIDGWEYPTVTVRCATGQTFVELISPDGALKRIPQRRIRVIRDQAGTDITATVLAGGGTPAPVLEPSGISAVPGNVPPALAPAPEASGESGRTVPFPTTRRQEPHSAQSKVTVGGGIGYGTASGNWFEGLTSGLSTDLGVKFMVGSQIYLGFHYCHQALGVEEDMKQIEGVPVDWDVSINEYIGLVGIRTVPRRDRDVIGYAECGLGSMGHNISAKVTSYDVGIQVGTHETKLGLYAGIGLMAPISPTVAIDFTASGRLTGSSESTGDPYAPTAGSDGWLIGVRAGLAFLL